MDSADQKLKVADHLISTTYSLVNEPKLLVSVIENLLSAMELQITEMLEYEKNFRPLHYDSKESKLDIFRRKIIPKYDLDPKIMDFIAELQNIVDEHKKSLTEFRRKQKFVITDKEYNIKTLELKDTKARFNQAKNYIHEIKSKMKLGG
jgi:hypothetical protein